MRHLKGWRGGRLSEAKVEPGSRRQCPSLDWRPGLGQRHHPFTASCPDSDLHGARWPQVLL